MNQQILMNDMRELYDFLAVPGGEFNQDVTIVRDGKELVTNMDAFRNLTNLLMGRTWEKFSGKARYQTMYDIIMNERYEAMDGEWRQVEHTYAANPESCVIALSIRHVNQKTREEHTEVTKKQLVRGEYLHLATLLLSLDPTHGTLHHIHRAFTMEVAHSHHPKTTITFVGKN
ncbi:hypothetical protein D9M71_645320 [compost metagenome]